MVDEYHMISSRRRPAGEPASVTQETAVIGRLSALVRA